MIVSLYATKYTREHMSGVKSPSVDLTNKKALEQPFRRANWEARQRAAKKTV